MTHHAPCDLFHDRLDDVSTVPDLTAVQAEVVELLGYNPGAAAATTADGGAAGDRGRRGAVGSEAASVSAPVIEPIRLNQDDDEGPLHVSCDCQPNLSLCGLHAPRRPDNCLDDEMECVVCVDLEELPCPRCGA